LKRKIGYAKDHNKAINVAIRAIDNEPSVPETDTPELSCGDGARYPGGAAINGGEWWWRPITSTSKRWPFLQ